MYSPFTPVSVLVIVARVPRVECGVALGSVFGHGGGDVAVRAKLGTHLSPLCHQSAAPNSRPLPPPPKLFVWGCMGMGEGTVFGATLETATTPS